MDQAHEDAFFTMAKERALERLDTESLEKAVEHEIQRILLDAHLNGMPDDNTIDTFCRLHRAELLGLIEAYRSIGVE